MFLGLCILARKEKLTIQEEGGVDVPNQWEGASRHFRHRKSPASSVDNCKSKSIKTASYETRQEPAGLWVVQVPLCCTFANCITTEWEGGKDGVVRDKASHLNLSREVAKPYLSLD